MTTKKAIDIEVGDFIHLLSESFIVYRVLEAFTSWALPRRDPNKEQLCLVEYPKPFMVTLTVARLGTHHMNDEWKEAKCFPLSVHSYAFLPDQEVTIADDSVLPYDGNIR